MNRMLYVALRSVYRKVRPYRPESWYYQTRYRAVYHRYCNFRNPKRFSEKLFHRMRYPERVFSYLADKEAVRDYIANVVGERYLVPVISVHDRIDETVIDSLPSAFVMKSNHSCSQVKIVTNKEQEDPAALIRLATEWLNSDYSIRGGEKHYSAIKPKILFEQPLLSAGLPPDDYKVYHFNPSAPGGPGRKAPSYALIQHIQGRFESPSQVFYTSSWEKMDLKRRGESNAGVSPRPDNLEEMLDLSEKLSKGLGFLRVDFYVYQGRLYIGELTLTPVAGRGTFDPESWDRIFGEKFGWPEDVSDIEAVFGLTPVKRSLHTAAPKLTDRQNASP